MCCYQLRDIPLDLSHPITGSLASQYFTSSVVVGGPIYLVKMLRSTALLSVFSWTISGISVSTRSLISTLLKNYREDRHTDTHIWTLKLIDCQWAISVITKFWYSKIRGKNLAHKRHWISQSMQKRHTYNFFVMGKCHGSAMKVPLKCCWRAAEVQTANIQKPQPHTFPC